VLSPPDGLGQDLLVSMLATHWLITGPALNYRPVGFGSHHWEVATPDGQRWFLTADELHYNKLRPAESADVAFGRLRAAIGAASDLRAAGASFVVAPVPAAGGEPVVRAGQDFAIAVYPFVTGETFGWGEFDGQGHRRAVLEMVVGVHTAPPAARRRALTDEYVIPLRAELESVLTQDAATRVTERGPFTRCAADLIGGARAEIGGLLARFDALAGQARIVQDRMVLTHGETHPGNTMRTADGWRLIDWDTAMIAQPERDLWDLDPGDGSILAGYAAATGVRPDPALLELFRIRWDLSDFAVDVSRFLRPHRGNEDDEKTWAGLVSMVGALRDERQPAPRGED
jgi:Phosphotransferase enzyme family